MKVNATDYRTIWLDPDDHTVVRIIDQRHLPHRFVIRDLVSLEDFRHAIADMLVRGAGLIGATAAYGMYIAATAAMRADDFDDRIREAAITLRKTRPTASNLGWAVDRQLDAMARTRKVSAKVDIAKRTAQEIADGDADCCRRIGEHGLGIIQTISQRKKKGPVNILTHCNAGWLAFVDYGSATAPIYAAHDAGISVHVWVDETRPRNQGAALTAWEFANHGVPHTLIVDNAGGHLMQHGMVDLVIVGTDRTTRNGDVANKIGTYLKALAAADNNVPFYVALPSSTFDFSLTDGVLQIPIEERAPDEVRLVRGKNSSGAVETVQICPDQTCAANFGFDVTPAHLVTKLITERGICDAGEAAITALFPDLAQ